MTQVASFSVLWTVSVDVTRPLAIVTSVSAGPITTTLWAAPGYVARLLTLVTGRHVWMLEAIFRDVTFTKATVAAIELLPAVSDIVTKFVTPVALLPAPVVEVSSIDVPL